MAHLEFAQTSWPHTSNLRVPKGWALQQGQGRQLGPFIPHMALARRGMNLTLRLSPASDGLCCNARLGSQSVKLSDLRLVLLSESRGAIVSARMTAMRISAAMLCGASWVWRFFRSSPAFGAARRALVFMILEEHI
jgi:hypothetical protein